MKRFIVALLLVLVAVPAVSGEYEILADGESKVVFESKAPMERFKGRTDRVWGSVILDPADLSAGLIATITVDMASLDTGLGNRNKHMRENHLQVDQFPNAEFRMNKVISSSANFLSSGGPVTATVEGEFELHGVVRTLVTDVRLELRPDGGIEASTEFVVLLNDHKISRPKFLFIKLAEEQLVKVTLTAYPSHTETESF